LLLLAGDTEDDTETEPEAEEETETEEEWSPVAATAAAREVLLAAVPLAFLRDSSGSVAWREG
jgi:hypothetical protein